MLLYLPAESAMFSKFSPFDWARLSAGVVLAVLFAIFASPISTFFGWHVSAAFMFSLVTLTLVLSNLGEFLARERLSPRTQRSLARALSAAGLALGILYLIFRLTLADALRLPQAVLDGGVLLVAVIMVVMIAAPLSDSKRPGREP
jgi:hypothetical protein